MADRDEGGASTNLLAVPELNYPPDFEALKGTVVPGGVYLVKEHDSLADWVGVINLLIVVAALALSIFDQRRKRREDLEDRDDALRKNVTAFWIQELVCRSHLPLIESYFDDIERKLVEVEAARSLPAEQALDAIRKANAEFKTRHHEIDVRVVQALQFIHSSFAPLSDLLDDIQDFVTTTIGLAPGIARRVRAGAPEEQLAELRKRFMMELHENQAKSLGLSVNREQSSKVRRSRK